MGLCSLCAASAPAKFIELKILEKLGVRNLLFSVSFVMGALDSADWMTDGIFPIQAYKCDAIATDRFAGSFRASWAWPLAPIVMQVHFFGIAYLVLINSAMAQQGLGSVSTPEFTVEGAAADAQGFGAVAKYFDDRNESSGAGWKGIALKGFTSLTRVLLENCFQLWLQSSFLGLVFERLSSSARQKALFSLILGLLSATYKSALAAKATIDCRSGYCLWAIVPLIALGMVVWTAAKIYFAWHCERHLWNLTSGCVHLD